MDLRSGDRFEIVATGLDGRLSLPAVLDMDAAAIEHLEDPAGRNLDVALDHDRGALIIPKLPENLTASAVSFWLEYRAPGRFRLIVEPRTPQPANGAVITEQGVPINFDERDWSVIHEASVPPAGLDSFKVAQQAARLATHAGL